MPSPAKLYLTSKGTVECGCDVSAMFGDCKHTAPEITSAWLISQVITLRDQLAESLAQIDALQELLNEARGVTG